MFNLSFDPISFVLATRKGISNRNAALFSAAMPTVGTARLSTAGSFLVADRVTDRIAARTVIAPVRTAPVSIAPVSIASVSTGTILPILAPIPISGTGITGGTSGTPTPTTQPPAPPAAFIQKIEGAQSIDLTTDPPEITGQAGLAIDFVSPVDANSYTWDFGSGSGINPSTAKNPTSKPYNTAGNFDVKLTLIDASGTESEVHVAKVIV